MAQGRKSKPTALKELEGNLGKREFNAKEPKPQKKAPACPKWLDDEAKAKRAVNFFNASKHIKIIFFSKKTLIMYLKITILTKLLKFKRNY